MDDPAPLPAEPANLRLLRRLVTALMIVMIAGITAVVVLMALRLRAPPPTPASVQAPVLPETIKLPGNSTPVAVTAGTDWYAVVTSADVILIFDRATGALRQTVTIEEQPE